MADENTTGSEPTPETAPTPAPASPDISTTEPSPQPEPDGGTILTDPAEPKADEPEQTEEQKATAALFGAPETDYEISGLPEGMTIDKDALAAFEPVAKQLGLSNEGMSLVAKTYAEILPKVVEGVTDNLQKDIAATQAQWASDALAMIQTDTAFGGKPLTDVKQVSAKALDRFGGEEFRTFLQDTGLGNHPAMVKFAYLAGSLIAEDTTFERGGTAPVAKSRVDKYYGAQT